MLRISRDQWESFGRERLGGFEARARAHLERFFPEIIQPSSDRRFRQFLEGCKARAAELGLTSERAILCVAHIALRLGPNAEEHPDFPLCRAVLADQDAPADFRAKTAMALAYDLAVKRES